MSNNKTELIPHPHQHYIKAWADGHVIYSRIKDSPNSVWSKVTCPSWQKRYEYVTEKELIHLNTKALPDRVLTAKEVYEEILDLINVLNKEKNTLYIKLGSIV